MTGMPSQRIDDIVARLDAMIASADAALVAAAPAFAEDLLALGDAILEIWLTAHDATPTTRKAEGFRLLALQRQGARGDRKLQRLPRDLSRARLPPQSRAASIPRTRTLHAGSALAPWWRDIWRSLSAASLKWQASANSAAHHDRFVRTKQTCSPPKSRDLKES